MFFVITVKFCIDLLRILKEIPHKTYPYLGFRYIHFHTNQVLLRSIRMIYRNQIQISLDRSYSVAKAIVHIFNYRKYKCSNSINFMLLHVFLKAIDARL